MLDTEHYTKKYLIPRTIQQVVCMCDEPGPLLFGDRKSAAFKMNSCSKCLKPYRHYARICTECKSYYVRDFRRVASCIRHQTCIECYETPSFNQKCDCGPFYSEGGICDYGPLGLNPRTYTAEETADVFTSGGPF